jgi:hypothetical protein
MFLLRLPVMVAQTTPAMLVSIGEEAALAPGSVYINAHDGFHICTAAAAVTAARLPAGVCNRSWWRKQHLLCAWPLVKKRAWRLAQCI